MVYNFCKTATVVEESENNEIKRYWSVGPKASRAIYTTFSSLKVMCLLARSRGQSPDTSVS